MTTLWWKKRQVPQGSAEERIRFKYDKFRDLLAYNNECLEVMAELQNDLQYVPPWRDVVGSRVTALLDRAEGMVKALEKLTGQPYPILSTVLKTQQQEVQNYIAAFQELMPRRLSAWLSEISLEHILEVGGKAATLGEIKNRLGLPVPDGYVLTTEAYRRFFGIPLWATIRDSVNRIDLSDLSTLTQVSRDLMAKVMEQPLDHAVEVAVTQRAQALETAGLGLAVRSSAVGEGGVHTFAGQFQSFINVPKDEIAPAFKRVIASRFGERALFYRLSTGLPDVDSPMAVLVLPTIRARASGIMYTRDPLNSKAENLWITATRGLGLDIASGRTPADLFVVSRSHPHTLLESLVAAKETEIVVDGERGLMHAALSPEAARAPSLTTEEIETLAGFGGRIEDHFKTPQDVEWVLDLEGQLWIVQTRPLTLAEESHARTKAHTRSEPLIRGGRTVYPGQVCGPACLVQDPQDLSAAPLGALVFMRRSSPEIVKYFPRIAGLVLEKGNLAGHVAALLREFKIPSVFQMTGAFERIKPSDPVSLDAVRTAVYPGTLWLKRQDRGLIEREETKRKYDPLGEKLLTLHLLNPSSFSFRPRGCRSTHDVLRFAHEKAIEAMFAINDREFQSGPHASKRLVDPAPINLYVLDLGGGLEPEVAESDEVRPDQITSRPFQAIWKGVSHPRVSWSRPMAANVDGIASVMAGALSSHSSAQRALGDKSYLILADEYMNLNSRLAYHFTLVDACVSDVANNNYIAFRFAGGGATRARRNLRAVFIESCLNSYGFHTDRRGDLLNAWFKKAGSEDMETHLDILGRLMACSSQLDMYMTNEEVMQWYVRQFLEGNYSFSETEEAEKTPVGTAG